MSADYIHLSQEGYEKLRAELDYLKKVKRREIAKALAYARSLGDLSENAEYDAAKNEQALLEKRIAELEDKLPRVKILDDEAIDKDKVYIGATVTLSDDKNKREIVYTLVAQEEADISSNKISTTSPIGRGLLGHKVGDEVEIKIPAGTLKYKIEKIER